MSGNFEFVAEIGRVASASGDEFSAVSRFCEEIFKDVAGDATNMAAVENYLARLNEKIFRDVNSERREDEGRTRAEHRRFEALHGKNARHLVIGCEYTFTDEEVANYVEGLKLGSFLKTDLSRRVGADVVADATMMPFEDGSLDSVWSNSVLEHIAYPHQVIEESWRVLGDGGIMFINVPYLFHVHQDPKDYLRYSPDFFEEVCKSVGFEDVLVFTEDVSGLFYCLHTLSKQATTADPDDAPMQGLLKQIQLLLAACTVFDDRLGNKSSFPMSVSCYAFKSGRLAARERPVEPGVRGLVDFLRCPVSKQKLELMGDRLVTVDGRHGYRVEEGVPILAPESSLFD